MQTMDLQNTTHTTSTINTVNNTISHPSIDTIIAAIHIGPDGFINGANTG
ncbi:hypothetical protein [Dictyobacter aurantiacus]|nr:hypothetical protein [Dictyobacter aurantiacus]